MALDSDYLQNETEDYMIFAHDVLLMAASGGMPDTFWQTDSRILRACEATNVTPEEAREWARENATRRV